MKGEYIMQYVEIDGIGPVLFERSKRAKRLIITITPQKDVRVAIPPRGSAKKAEAFVLSKTGWIKKQLSLMDQAEREFGRKSMEIDRISARQTLIERLDKLAEKHGFTYNKVTIRNQKTRWGSCSIENNISLNIKLILLPEELMDYVILHELVHTLVKNHGKDFWAKLGNYVPDPKEKVSQLRKYGLALL